MYMYKLKIVIIIIESQHIICRHYIKCRECMKTLVLYAVLGSGLAIKYMRTLLYLTECRGYR